MRMQHERDGRTRRRVAVLFVGCVAACTLVVVARLARGDRAADATVVSRPLASADALDPAVRLALSGAPDGADPSRRRTVELPDTVSASIDPDAKVTIVVRPRPIGASARLHASIGPDSQIFYGWFGSVRVGLDGTATFAGPRAALFDRGCQIVFANSREALSKEKDGRLLFRETDDLVGRIRLTSERIELVDGEPVIDLGTVALERPLSLATLRVSGADGEPFQVEMGVWKPGAFVLAPQQVTSFGSNSGLERQARRHFPPDVREVAITTFGRRARWEATVEPLEWGEPVSVSGSPGATVHVVLREAAGVRGTVNLRRHPSAAWVFVVRASDAERPTELDGDAFDARQSAAERSLAVPLPERRSREAEYPLGHVELADGVYVVELWSLQGEDGRRRLLDSESVSVAGEPVDVDL